jgi:COMPASS component SWD3
MGYQAFKTYPEIKRTSEYKVCDMLNGDSKNFVRSSFAGDEIVVGGSEDGVGYVWDAGTGGIISRLVAHTGIVYNLAWNAKQNLFVSCSDDKTVKTWWSDTK